MNVLIVSATLLEIEQLLVHFNFEKEINQNLNSYTYKSHRIDILKTGVGMTNTAFMMGRTLAKESYDLAINLGIAGSFDNTIKIGETVHVITDQISELGAEDGDDFLSLDEMGLSDNDTEIINSFSFKNSVISTLKEVKGITVNTVHGNKESIEKITKRLNPQTESMEGAAFFIACKAEKIKCAQIRTISNIVERRNRNNWDIPKALNNLSKTGLKIIDTL